jgi:hypothetical protein
MADEDAKVEEAEGGDAPVLPGDEAGDTRSPTGVVHEEYRKVVCEDCKGCGCDTCYQTGYYAALSHPVVREIARFRKIVDLAWLVCLDHSCNLEGEDGECNECNLSKVLWDIKHEQG